VTAVAEHGADDLLEGGGRRVATWCCQAEVTVTEKKKKFVS
jgi:hypothetical protein